MIVILQVKSFVIKKLNFMVKIIKLQVQYRNINKDLDEEYIINKVNKFILNNVLTQYVSINLKDISSFKV